MANHVQFQAVLSSIQLECDEQDNSEGVYRLYLKILDRYFVSEVEPKMTGLVGEEVLTMIAKQWINYTIFAHLHNRIFKYLRNFLNDSQFFEKLGPVS